MPAEIWSLPVVVRSLNVGNVPASIHGAMSRLSAATVARGGGRAKAATLMGQANMAPLEKGQLTAGCNTPRRDSFARQLKPIGSISHDVSELLRASLNLAQGTLFFGLNRHDACASELVWSE